MLPQAAFQQTLLSPAEHTYALCCSRFWPEKANTLSVSFQQLNLSFKGDYTLLRVGIFATKMSNLYYQLCNGVQQATFSDEVTHLALKKICQMIISPPYIIYHSRIINLKVKFLELPYFTRIIFLYDHTPTEQNFSF